MTPEEYLEKFRSMRGINAPQNFDQRFKGDTYGIFPPSPNVEDRRDEGLANGMLGAVMAKVLQSNVLKSAASMLPSAAAQAAPQNPMPAPSELSRQAGTDELDQGLIRQAFGKPAFPPQPTPDPAADMVNDTIQMPMDGEDF
jgi:hypothetical protein